MVSGTAARLACFARALASQPPIMIDPGRWVVGVDSAAERDRRGERDRARRREAGKIIAGRTALFAQRPSGTRKIIV